MKKKNIKWIYHLAIMGVFLILTNSCEKDNNTTPKDIITDIDEIFITQ